MIISFFVTGYGLHCWLQWLFSSIPWIHLYQRQCTWNHPCWHILAARWLCLLYLFLLCHKLRLQSAIGCVQDFTMWKLSFTAFITDGSIVRGAKLLTMILFLELENGLLGFRNQDPWVIWKWGLRSWNGYDILWRVGVVDGEQINSLMVTCSDKEVFWVIFH